MRKISLVLAALLGLSGVAYGANWVEIGHGNGDTQWAAQSRVPGRVWEKMTYTQPLSINNSPYNQVVYLLKANCRDRWVKPLQVNYSMNGRNPYVLNEFHHVTYAVPGSGVAVLLNVVCRK